MFPKVWGKQSSLKKQSFDWRMVWMFLLLLASVSECIPSFHPSSWWCAASPGRSSAGSCSYPGAPSEPSAAPVSSPTDGGCCLFARRSVWRRGNARTPAPWRCSPEPGHAPRRQQCLSRWHRASSLLLPQQAGHSQNYPNDRRMKTLTAFIQRFTLRQCLQI